MEEVKQKVRRKSSSERKLEILRTLVSLISESECKHITTKTLAAKLGVSEAALYRHFPSKTKMYSEIIGFAESYVVTWINKIASENVSGVEQAKLLYQILVSIIETEPGLVSLLCGEALALEDAALQDRINQIYRVIQSAFKQSLNIGIAQKELPESYDSVLRASMLTSLVLGHWLRFVKKSASLKEIRLEKEAVLIIGR